MFSTTFRSGRLHVGACDYAVASGNYTDADLNDALRGNRNGRVNGLGVPTWYVHHYRPAGIR